MDVGVINILGVMLGYKLIGGVVFGCKLADGAVLGIELIDCSALIVGNIVGWELIDSEEGAAVRAMLGICDVAVANSL